MAQRVIVITGSLERHLELRRGRPLVHCPGLYLWKEAPMATMVGTERGFLNTLGDLMALEQDAIAAYDAAITRIDDAGFKAKLQEFKADHERHVSELDALIAKLGGAPSAGAGLKSMLTQGIVAIGSLFGDKTILRAMKSNEDDTNTAYERAVKHRDVDAAAVRTLERGLADERRHRAWIEETIAGLQYPT